MSYRALQLRIYPNENQKNLIEQTFGCCRQIYNTYLNERKNYYENEIKPYKENLSQSELIEKYKNFKHTKDKEYSQKFEYMRNVSSTARHESLRHAQLAYNNFLKTINKSKNSHKYGFPRFKSKKYNQSYTDRLNEFNFFSKYIKIPKLDRVKFSHSKLPNWSHKSKIKGVTVKRTTSYKYYIVVLFEIQDKEESKKRKKNKNILGLDFSPNKLYVDSNNKSAIDFGFKDISNDSKYALKKKKIQRILSQKQKYSSNYNKTKIKLSRIEEKIRNIKREFIEKETLRLIKTYDEIHIEDLNLKELMQKSYNAKNYMNSSYSFFISRLMQKSQDHDCRVIEIDKYYPSSKMCHVCKNINNNLKLSDRTWICEYCSTIHDRDHNAAINIRNYVPLEQRKLKPEFKSRKTTRRRVSEDSSFISWNSVH